MSCQYYTYSTINMARITHQQIVGHFIVNWYVLFEHVKMKCWSDLFTMSFPLWTTIYNQTFSYTKIACILITVQCYTILFKNQYYTTLEKLQHIIQYDGIRVEKKPHGFTDFWTLRIISLTQKTTWNTLVSLYDAVSKRKFKFSIKVNFQICWIFVWLS